MGHYLEVEVIIIKKEFSKEVDHNSNIMRRNMIMRMMMTSTMRNLTTCNRICIKKDDDNDLLIELSYPLISLR